RLLSRPAVAVDPGVDHQPRRAPHRIALLAEPLVGRAVDAHLDPEPLAIEAPALAVAREIEVLAEARKRLLLDRQRGLEAVAGLALVQRQHRDVVQRPA